MKNTYRLDDSNQVVFIDAELPNGEKHIITVSISKLEMLLNCTSRWTLYGKTKLYARGYIKGANGMNRRLEMHRFLTDCPVGLVVDHLDGNGLNNCDENLRVCTHTANNQNASSRKDNTSGFTGVSRMNNGKFKATISVEGKNIHIGTFNSAVDASDAYQLAKQRFHPFADRNSMIFI